jgi:hypothetical protein
MRKVQWALLMALCAVWLNTETGLAWPGGAPAQVVISGPGIQGEVTVKERVLLDGLGPEQFVDFAQRLSPAPQLGEGFRLTRYTPMESSSEQFVDHLRYFPHPRGGRGIVVYDGSERGGGEAFKGSYFYATRQGADAMRVLIQKLGGSLTVSQPNGPAGATLQLDALPSPIVADQRFTLGFTAKAGGRQPLGDMLIVYANEAGSSTSTVFTAQADDAPGHYHVTLTLPRAGLWYWAVDLGVLEGRQEMPPLDVVNGAAATSGNPAATAKSAADDMPYVLSLLAVAVALLGGIVAGVWLRRRGRTG